MKKDLTTEILNIIEKEVDPDSQDYIAMQLNELFASQFASLNPERIMMDLLNKIRERVRSLDKSDNQIYRNNKLLILFCYANAMEIIENYISDLCSGSQEKEDEIICRDGYIIFPKNNNIPYGQDFNFWQNIPSKIKFYPAFFGNERIKFIGDGYGILNDNIYKLIGKYGNGAIFVSVKDLPENVKEYCMNNLLNSL